MLVSAFTVGAEQIKGTWIYFGEDRYITYNTCDEITENLEENINNYFLPAAYDISPFTISTTWCNNDLNCEDFYSSRVVRDEKEKISVPPIYTLLVTDSFMIENLDVPVMESYIVYYYGNKNNMSMTDTMWRSLNKDGYDKTKRSSEKSAIDAFIAPWTFYDKSGLYTWPEIMAMTEEEISALDFDTFEFAKFISNLKSVLEARGWWKEEYQERYELLATHKDDYHKAQSEDEIFEIDGDKVYLEHLNSEYFSGGTGNIDNILSVNIYKPEVKEKLSGLKSDVREKYSVVINAIEKELKTNLRDDTVKYGNENYKDGIGSEFAPSAYACYLPLTALCNFVEGNVDNVRANDLKVISMIKDCGKTEEEIRAMFERYNYIASEGWSFNSETVDMFVNATKRELIDYFKFDTSIVTNYDEISLIPWWMVKVYYDVNGNSYIYSEEYIINCDDFGRLIGDLEALYNRSPENEKADIREYIEYLKEHYSPPVTGDNSVLYVIIAAASLTAMSALAFRRKRKVTE